MKSSPLEQLIIQKIKSQGPIPFDEFMKMALYYPERGYYTRKELKIGREGDFFTASHLGKVFGIFLSRKINKLWQKIGLTDEFSITEIGPGMGYLASDLLEEFERDNILPKYDFKYNMVEINPELVKLQIEKLKKYTNYMLWYDSIKKIPNLKGIVICNEILDALPIRIFEIRDGNVFEVYVDIKKDEEITEIIMPARTETVAYLEEFAPHVLKLKSYRSEVNLEMKALIENLASILIKGFVIIFDYGFDAEEYYAQQRTQGTLLCYYKHTINENPYIHIGEQDITSHINFSALEKWAKEAGFNLEEYTSQSKFFISLSDEALLERFSTEGLINKFKRLVLPQGMGETHRVMILSKY